MMGILIFTAIAIGFCYLSWLFIKLLSRVIKQRKEAQKVTWYLYPPLVLSWGLFGVIVLSSLFSIYQRVNSDYNEPFSDYYKQQLEDSNRNQVVPPPMPKVKQESQKLIDSISNEIKTSKNSTLQFNNLQNGNIITSLKKFYEYYDRKNLPSDAELRNLAKRYAGKEKELWVKLYSHSLVSG
ncbi:MAG: hypothetical protein ACK4TA_04735 [Saprospiraceae bacterium]